MSTYCPVYQLIRDVPLGQLPRIFQSYIWDVHPSRARGACDQWILMPPLLAYGDEEGM